MSPPNGHRGRRLLAIAVLLSLIVWRFITFSTSTSPSPLSSPHSSAAPQPPSTLSKDLQNSGALPSAGEAHAEVAKLAFAPLVSTTKQVKEHSSTSRASDGALRRMCRGAHSASSAHEPAGVTFVLTLDRTLGGLGNLRGQLLDFIYFALHAAGRNLSILLPSALHTRPKAPPIPTDRFFDIPFLVAQLRAACPDLLVFSSRNDLPAATTKYVRHVHVIQATRNAFSRSSSGGGQMVSIAVNEREASQGEVLQLPQQADLVARRVREFWSWCNKTVGNLVFTTPGLTHVVVPTRRADGVLWDFDLRGREQTLRRVELGAALRVAPAARRVAASILCNLRGERGKSALQSQSRNKPQERHVVCGCHMRTEDDMRHLASIGNATTQSAAFLAEAAFRNCSVLYVAGGKPHHVERLKRMTMTGEAANDSGTSRGESEVKILHKDEIMDQLMDSIAALDNASYSGPTSPSKYRDLFAFSLRSKASWDFRALVDYEVLSQCDYFFGVTTSSFSWNIAIRRHFSGIGEPGPDAHPRADTALDEELWQRKKIAECATQVLDQKSENPVTVPLLSSVGIDRLTFPPSRAVPWTYDDGRSVLFLRMTRVTHKNLEARAAYGMWP